MAEQEEPVVLIVAGHYRMKSHAGEESKEIVRVLGPSPSRKGHWKTMDGKDMSEYDLLENWEPLKTAVNQNQPTTNRLMAGLMPIADAERAARGETAPQEEEPEEEHAPTAVRPQKQPPYPVFDDSKFLSMVVETGGEKKHTQTLDDTPRPSQQPQPAAENSFIASIFKKLVETTSEDLNPITVTFELPLPFDIERLKESMSLLDLDANEVVKHIIDRMLQKSRVNNAISANLHQLLTEPKRGKSAREIVREQYQSKTENGMASAAFNSVVDTFTPMLELELKTEPKRREIPYVPVEDRTFFEPTDIDAKAQLDKRMEAEVPKPFAKAPVQAQQVTGQTLDLSNITEISEEISALEQKTAAMLKKYIG